MEETGEFSISDTVVLDSSRPPKTTISKRHLLIGISLAIIVLLAIIVVAGFCTKGFGVWENRVCGTLECARAAAHISARMDENANPCQDFYQYACAKFEKDTVIPLGWHSVSAATTLESQNQIKMKTVLENPTKVDHLKIVKNVKKFYRSCMDETELERLGAQLLLDYMIIGGEVWPSLDPNWKEFRFNLEAYLTQIGIHYSKSLISVAIYPNPIKSTERVIAIEQGELLLKAASFYQSPKEDNPVLQALENMMVDVTVALGGDETSARKDMAEVIEFERKLANITVSIAQRKLPTNSKLSTFVKMAEEFPGIDYMKTVNGILSQVDFKVSKSTSVYVLDIPYMKKLGDIINRTPRRTLATYIMFKSFNNFRAYSNKAMREADSEVAKIIYGENAAVPQQRYVTCTTLVNQWFPNTIARMIVAEYSVQERLIKFEDLISAIRNEFKKNLHELDWLDASTRHQAQIKFDSMLFLYQYPVVITTDEVLEKMSTIELNEKQFLENVFELTRDKIYKSVGALHMPIPRLAWPVKSVWVNAFYNPTQNIVTTPMGILQTPFFDENNLKVLNFGAIGTVLAHEITHGFDDFGRRYDKVGNYREWMSEASIEKFYEKARCVVDKYSNITIKGLNRKVNGKQTLGDNIADIASIKLAFNAFLTWVKEHGREKSLPGIDLEPEKVFFLSYAQLYCHKMSLQSLDLAASEDVHTTPRERVNGALANSEQFARVFQCPPGSGMNPGGRCTVW